LKPVRRTRDESDSASTISATSDPGIREAAARRLEYGGIEYARLPAKYAGFHLMNQVGPRVLIRRKSAGWIAGS
jgi:hypothetical protein